MKCRFAAVPDGIVPPQIVTYVGDIYPDAKILEIDRDKRDIELKLDIRVELAFDLQYNIIDIGMDCHPASTAMRAAPFSGAARILLPYRRPRYSHNLNLRRPHTCLQISVFWRIFVLCALSAQDRKQFPTTI